MAVQPLTSSIQRTLLATIISMTVAVFARAQDPVIFRAMKDELKRNMTELALEGYERPFFISYTVADQHEMSVNASLGAVVRSNEYPARSTISMTRVWM
jgi:hypothetical protein